eukprot:scaffold14931_cov19-Tisochrysis_lutea.AAC.1
MPPSNVQEQPANEEVQACRGVSSVKRWGAFEATEKVHACMEMQTGVGNHDVPMGVDQLSIAG